MTIGKGKRPRDPNQLAKWIVDQSTSGQNPETDGTEPLYSNHKFFHADHVTSPLVHPRKLAHS
jgi:hypothetical protein